MAIVEDEIQNGSEGENEIEVVVEEDDGDQDSDSEDEGTELDLERKVSEYEHRVAVHPLSYDDHIEMIQLLWRLSDLDRWRAAFERLWEVSLLKPEHWLLWIRTEENLSHTQDMKNKMADLYYKATCDCFSMPILSKWSTWALSFEEAPKVRSQLDEVLRRGGADPFSGKLLWDLKIDFEKSQYNIMSKTDPVYKEQEERLLWCLEVAVSRPLKDCTESWNQFKEFALKVRDEDYVFKVEDQHKAALEFLQKIMPYEMKTKTIENQNEKYKVYEEYIELVKDMAQEKRYADCDGDGLLRVLYDRVTHECGWGGWSCGLLLEFSRHARATSSRASYWRVLDLATRRCPHKHTFWALKMRQAEHEQKPFEEVKSILESALSKNLESYKEAELLWLCYLEYVRRRTDYEEVTEVDRLRRTFRLAWDSLAETWGEEANDCEIPLYWARLEYKFLGDPKQGRDIFEELFRYGTNKTMSKYWEALIDLEGSRTPHPSDHKYRDLLRRGLRSVSDYPPAIARIWTDFERDQGTLSSSEECTEACEDKIKEWKENYQAMKENMTGKRGGHSSKNKDNKKKKTDNKQKGKRKSDGDTEASDVKKKREGDMDVDTNEKDGDSSGGMKRTHETDDAEEGSNKRQRKESEDNDQSSTGRDACTVFVSNLDFKINEKNLRDKLSEYGEIVSLRVKAGVKAFGGSICYCQYKTAESVEEAIKHDRVPLDGRPMFLSRYSAKKTKPTFKYSTEAEKNKVFVKNLPYTHSNKEALTEVFSKYGKLKDIRVVTFKDGKPKGLAYIEYEDEASAAEAVRQAHGTTLAQRVLSVALSDPPPRALPGAPGPPAPTLGMSKRDTGGGMRRTQLSFVPRVLQQSSMNKASTSATNTAAEKRTLSNDDFRNIAASSSSHDN